MTGDLPPVSVMEPEPTLANMQLQNDSNKNQRNIPQHEKASAPPFGYGEEEE
ncbi:hypothetical protein KC717_06680 [Candidatus Dojkabacteria bacterium]|uniref:Uncharacterized protein n=1 Tax=Candidatus Dojkabacteria bacterium TaxID=2099670 RepID=A0A955L9V6_9BACT|nr:hypothetical protein [Candidatus Dojkabacteria bacterium]